MHGIEYTYIDEVVAILHAFYLFSYIIKSTQCILVLEKVHLTSFSTPTTKIIPASATNCVLFGCAVSVATTKAWSPVFISQILTSLGFSHHNFFCINKHHNNIKILHMDIDININKKYLRVQLSLTIKNKHNNIYI